MCKNFRVFSFVFFSETYFTSNTKRTEKDLPVSNESAVIKLLHL